MRQVEREAVHKDVGGSVHEARRAAEDGKPSPGLTDLFQRLVIGEVDLAVVRIGREAGDLKAGAAVGGVVENLCECWCGSWIGENRGQISDIDVARSGAGILRGDNVDIVLRIERE
jgi:hypothetical protein